MATEAMQIANLTFHSADISDRRACAAEFLCALDVFAHHTSSRITGEEFIIYLADGKYFHSVVMFYLRKRITLKIFI
jgi:hypothetical protein